MKDHWHQEATSIWTRWSWVHTVLYRSLIQDHALLNKMSFYWKTLMPWNAELLKSRKIWYNVLDVSSWSKCCLNLPGKLSGIIAFSRGRLLSGLTALIVCCKSVCVRVCVSCVCVCVCGSPCVRQWKVVGAKLLYRLWMNWIKSYLAFWNVTTGFRKIG